MLRMKLATFAATALLILGACSPGAQTASELNVDRIENGLTALPFHVALNRKAQRWADILAWTNTLQHSMISDGLPSCWRSAAENVGVGLNVSTIQDAYMDSPEHRVHVLGDWDYIGTGATSNGERMFTVQVFMRGC